MNTRKATAADWLRDMALDHTPANPRVDAARLGAAALDLVQRYVREVADAPDEAITGELVDAYWALAAKASQPLGHRSDMATTRLLELLKRLGRAAWTA